MEKFSYFQDVQVNSKVFLSFNRWGKSCELKSVGKGKIESFKLTPLRRTKST